MGRPRLVITRRIYEHVLQPLRDVFDIIADNQADDVPWTPELMKQKLAHAEYVLCSVADRMDADVLAAAPHLRVVANAAVGTNNIDLAACKARGIRVTNTPDVLTETTADFGFALMMAVARRIPESERDVRAGRWTGWAFDQFAGRDIHGSTLGIIGMGRIGSAIARRAAGFRMRVIYHNRQAMPDDGLAQWVDRDRLLSESDFVMLVVPYSPATHHLIGAAELSRMKPSAMLSDIARGGGVEDAALVEALREHKAFEGEEF